MDAGESQSAGFFASLSVELFIFYLLYATTTVLIIKQCGLISDRKLEMS